MTPIIFGVFGLIVGSFLNVLVLRYEKESLGGRSHCSRCMALIHWHDNIPVISWLLLRGRCRACRTRISLQYPLVELVTAVLFVGIGVSSLALPVQIVSCVMVALLIAIAVYDLHHRIIPDPWVYGFSGLALLTQLVFSPPHGVAIFTILSGPIAALPLFALWLVSRGAWMGFGDVKLALGIGWLLGPLYGLCAVFFAFVIGAVVSMPLLVASSGWWRRYVLPRLATWGQVGVGGRVGFTMKSEIPFGPFLAASVFLIWLLLINTIDPLTLVGLSGLAALR